MYETKKTKQYTVIVRDYPSKEKFRKDLNANGYAVVRISNNRDLAAQDKGNYKSFNELKKYSFNKEEIERIMRIEL